LHREYKEAKRNFDDSIASIWVRTYFHAVLLRFSTDWAVGYGKTKSDVHICEQLGQRCPDTTVFLCAAEFGLEEVVNKFLFQNASKDHPLSLSERAPILVQARNRQGSTALHLALANIVDRATQLSIVRSLLAAKSDPVARDGQGQTHLSILAQRPQHSLEACDVLLHAIYLKFDASEGVSSLATELHSLITKCGGSEKIMIQAVKDGRENVIRALLDVGITANARDPRAGLAALHLAVQRSHVNIVKMLLENGADPNLQSSRGETALHFAARQSREDAVRLLLNAKVNITIQNERGETAMDIAKTLSNGSQTIMEMLASAEL
jgi:ankyrin repeat protein